MKFLRRKFGDDIEIEQMLDKQKSWNFELFIVDHLGKETRIHSKRNGSEFCETFEEKKIVYHAIKRVIDSIKSVSVSDSSTIQEYSGEEKVSKA